MEPMKRLEILAKFLSYLGVDIRKYEILCGLLPLVLFPYVLLSDQKWNPEDLMLGNSVLILFFFILGFMLLRLKSCPGKNECKDYPIIEL